VADCVSQSEGQHAVKLLDVLAAPGSNVWFLWPAALVELEGP